MRRSVRGKGQPARRLGCTLVVASLVCAAAASAASAAGSARRSEIERTSSVSRSGPVSSLVGSLVGMFAPPGGGCSWRAQYGNGGTKVLETDTDAAYWATSYLSLSGSGMTITGTFPQARNMSFTVYHVSGAVRGGHLYDQQIQPDAGTVNPFQQGQTGSGTYTLHVVDAATPADPAPNTLYTDTNGVAADVELVYRVYDPTDPTSPAGGVPLPATTVTRDGKIVQQNQPCVGSPPPTAPAGTVAAPARTVTAAVRRAHRRARPHLLPVGAPPTWLASKTYAIFSDPDNAYLSVKIHAFDGQLVVFQAVMPTFPNTNAGQPPWAPAQVRYWSMCENNGVLPIVVACAADFNTVQNNGVATFVISSPSNRPPNATAADGVTWLPWGSQPDSLILYRQMLADPSFGQSIANVPAGSAPGTTMGAYLPQIAYCSEAEFAAAGAAGCLPSSASAG